MGSEGSAFGARGETAPAARRWRSAVAVATAVLMAVVATWLPAGSAGAEVVPFRMDASNQAGWWSPLAERDGNLYVAYNAWGGATSGGASDTHTVYVARRDSAGRWVRGCLPVPRGSACATYADDVGHRQPSLAIDGQGYLHVFAAMHNDSWRYFRSSVPGDPTTLVDRSSQMPDFPGSLTYPNATETPDGNVYVIARYGRSGRLYRWNDVTRLWTHEATFASQRDYIVYPDDIVSDADGNLHIAWEWSYGRADGLRHLGSYLRYEPAAGRFTNAAGAELAVPVGIASPVVYQPLVAGERSTDRGSATNPPGIQSAKLTIDPATGRPLVGYRLRATAGGRFIVRLARWDGTAWRRETVYAGQYTTYAAVDVTVDRQGRPRVYYAKTGVPSRDQAFVSVRRTDGRWVEAPPLLPRTRVERLAVIQDPAGTVDTVYMAVPSAQQLHVERFTL